MEIRSLFKGIRCPQQGFFAQCLAMSWAPTGMLSTKPQGMEIPGRPAMFTGMVVTSSM